MERYFKRKLGESSSSSPTPNDSLEVESSKQSELGEILAAIPTDPGLRPPMSDYDPNIRDQVRRGYLQKGPCQPKNHTFPQSMFGGYARRFNPHWFSEYPTWLEYSISKDAAFCLCCYLFKSNFEQVGADAFTGEGFSNWKKKDRLQVHVGGPSSDHNRAFLDCQALMNQRQHIESVIIKHSSKARIDYRKQLTATLDCIRFLLRQGLSFRGHNETRTSKNRGNFLELLQFLADHNDSVKAVVLENAPRNLQLTAHDIQKDIVNAAATEVINAIISDIGDALFSLMVDESRDVSIKEQMAVVFRYVDKKGQVIERFIGIQHVTSTTALSLKEAVDLLFSRHGLSISKLRGQGYDGASNMQGEFNGLKTLILNENPCAFYVHCFAHQLQLALVAVAKNHIQIATFFVLVSKVANVVGASCKRRDSLREKQQLEVMEAIQNDEIVTGQGLNQEISVKRPGDTRWGSHYGTLLNMISMFSPIISVLEDIVEDGISVDQKGEANLLMESMQSFHFVFCLFVMKVILGITNDLSQSLQRKNQDIVHAMILVNGCKHQLQVLRDHEWDSLLDKVSSFCVKNDICVPNMDDAFVPQGRSRRGMEVITNLHHYRVELFYTIIDMQLQELNNRFNEVSTELLICVACLSPDDSFSAFDKQKLVRLAELYPNDFSNIELLALEDQLGTYITDMRMSGEFSQVKGIGNLAKKLVETGRDKSYSLVYLLLTLALILPVATASVERAFSAMKIVKNPLRNRMGDHWMNDILIVYIEKDVFDSIDNEAIILRFQSMKTRRGQL